MGFLSSFLYSFKTLFGMPAGPNAFLAFSELIFKVTSSWSVGLSVKVSSTNSKRKFEKFKFGIVNFASICLAIVVNKVVIKIIDNDSWVNYFFTNYQNGICNIFWYFGNVYYVLSNYYVPHFEQVKSIFLETVIVMIKFGSSG